MITTLKWPPNATWQTDYLCLVHSLPTLTDDPSCLLHSPQNSNASCPIFSLSDDFASHFSEKSSKFPPPQLPSHHPLGHTPPSLLLIMENCSSPSHNGTAPPPGTGLHPSCLLKDKSPSPLLHHQPSMNCMLRRYLACLAHSEHCMYWLLLTTCFFFFSTGSFLSTYKHDAISPDCETKQNLSSPSPPLATAQSFSSFQQNFFKKCLHSRSPRPDPHSLLNSIQTGFDPHQSIVIHGHQGYQ